MRRLAHLLSVLTLAAVATAQGTAADYERAAAQGRLPALVRHFAPVLHWLPESRGVWWRNGDRGFVVVEADGSRRDSATAPEAGVDAGPEPLPPAAANARSRSTGGDTVITLRNGFDRKLAVQWIDGDGAAHAYGELEAHAVREQHTFAGHVWRLQFEDGEIAGVFAATAAPGLAVIDTGSQRAATPRRRRPQPDAPASPRPFRTFVEHDNLWAAAKGGEPFALTDDGTADDAYEAPRAWSPDGTKVLAMQVQPAQQHDVPLVESAPKQQLQPRLLHAQYLKPGDRIAVQRPRLFDLSTRQRIAVDPAPFADAWSIDHWRWADDGSCVYCLYNRRGHQRLCLYAIDAASGAVRTVIDEHSDTFVDYSQKTWLHWLDGEQLLWASERDGHNHLYLVDARTGASRQITRGDWVVRKVERVDGAAKQIWFTAYGIRQGQDPYYAHLARIDFDGSHLTVLTAADGTHEWTFSPDGALFVDKWSRVDQPPVTELRRSGDGSLVAELGRDDAAALLATGWLPPERFVAKGRDGSTDIFGILIRPSNFAAGARYPVIEDIYAGPHDHFVPKAWGLGRRQRMLAELGFVVVQIDGMGTNWRSKQFHDVCWQNLADSGFPDRIAWLRAAAAVHAELDLSRIGIYGGSAGGQSALAALLHHGDFYRAAAADCGCHDNRMDKIWWNEAWMGWPIGPQYAANSNVTHAAKLQGKLLLTVGELDRNVDPASTLQVVDALIKADKDFDFVLVPGAGHGIGESPYLVRRRQDFFVRNLLGKEPRR